MKLSLLMAKEDARALSGDAEAREVTSVVCDSRAARPGSLFFALHGVRAEGLDYVEQAVRAGAVAVVSEAPPPAAPTLSSIPWLRVGNARRALAFAAARIHGRPANALVLLGVTGTNGKTTTTAIAEAMLEACGERPGVVGTNGYRFAGRQLPATHTTPDPCALHALFAQMREAGTSAVAMEVSSHALAQERVHGLSFASAAFTNLTRDHLDYHGDMERYFDAKRRLFLDHCAGPATVNALDPFGRRLMDELLREGRTVWGFAGEGSEAELHLRDLSCTIDGLEGLLVTPMGEAPFRSRLIGRHNAENLLAATGLLLGAGYELRSFVPGIEALRAVPGRLERATERGPAVFVDYAHTNDALARALAALRPLTSSRLLLVFGCGGERDKGKRPLMGRAAAASELCIVTSDNPRSEAPMAIIEEIVPGLREQGMRELSLAEAREGARGFLIEPDRREALRLCAALAGAKDTVLVAGKGHETTQTIGEEVRPFDDRAEARAVFEEVRG